MIMTFQMISMKNVPLFPAYRTRGVRSLKPLSRILLWGGLSLYKEVLPRTYFFMEISLMQKVDRNICAVSSRMPGGSSQHPGSATRNILLSQPALSAHSHALPVNYWYPAWTRDWADELYHTVTNIIISIVTRLDLNLPSSTLCWARADAYNAW